MFSVFFLISALIKSQDTILFSIFSFLLLISKTFSCKYLENSLKVQEFLPFQTSDFFLATNVMS